MKKFIIIALALIAVAVGVYFYKNKSPDGDIMSSVSDALSGSSSSQVLEYVPADTIIFAGNLEAIDYEKLMEFNRNLGFNFESMGVLFDDAEVNLDDAPDGAKFAFGLFKAMLANMNGDYPKLMGVPSKTDGAIYTVGALPVMRMSLDGSNTFNELVAKIESKHGITAKVANLDGVEYREYSFGDDVPLTLVVSTHNNQAVVTVNTKMDDAKDLKLTLGIEKPAKSFTQSSRLGSTVDRFGYEGHQLMLVDSLGIVEGLTNPQANQFGSMLDELFVTYGINNGPGISPLAEFQTPECRTEYTALAANWPTISAGYTSYKAKSANYKMVVEGTNAGLLETLQKLHGHVSPSIKNEDLLMGIGMGVNMGELTSVITDLWKRMTKEPFNCSSLADMQAEMKQSNPVMQLGMVSGMLGGIKGFGFGIADMDLSGLQQAQNNPMAATNAMSMFISISADDPMSLVQLVGQFQPMLAGIELEEGAAPKALPLPLPMQVNGTLRGHDLVLSFGEKADAIAANLNSNSNIDYNGLMSFNYDMGKYFGMLNQAMEMEAGKSPKTAEAEKAREMMKNMFKDVKGRYSDKTSFTNNGLEVSIEMNID